MSEIDCKTYDELRKMGWSIAETWQYLIEQSFDDKESNDEEE